MLFPVGWQNFRGRLTTLLYRLHFLRVLHLAANRAWHKYSYLLSPLPYLSLTALASFMAEPILLFSLPFTSSLHFHPLEIRLFSSSQAFHSLPSTAYFQKLSHKPFFDSF
jgi:hypothetical protein